MLPPPINFPPPDPVLIDAADVFMSPADQASRPGFPDFTKEDLLQLGVTFASTEKTKLLTIPLKTQRKLVESVKGFGFGVNKATDLLLRRILQEFGFEGEVNFSTPAGTFTLCASQDIQVAVSPALPEQELSL